MLLSQVFPPSPPLTVSPSLFSMSALPLQPLTLNGWRTAYKGNCSKHGATLRAPLDVVYSLHCIWLCNPLDCSMPGFPVHHQLPELAQTHVHRVSDAIQPSHPLSLPSSPAFNPSKGTQGWFPLELTGSISLQSKGPSRVFSSITIQKHQFFGAQPPLWSNSHICAWLLEKP